MGAFVASAALAVTAGAAAAEAPRRLEPGSLLAWKWVADPQVSPDGRRVAYVLQAPAEKGTKYAGDIWVASTGGGEPRPLITHESHDRTPRWSPDGRLLAFHSNRSGKAQLWILEAEGEPWQLTDSVTDVGAFAWSPDGRRIAYAGTPPKPGEGEPGYEPPKQVVFTTERLNFRNDGTPGFRTEDVTQLFTVTLPSDRSKVEPVQVTRDAYDHGDPQWSADGTRIYFTANDKEDADYVRWDSEILVVPADGSTAPVRVTDRRGGDQMPRLSPDGRELAYLGSDVDPEALLAYDPTRLYLLTLGSTGPPREVRLPGAAGDGIITDSSPPRLPSQVLAWSGDGRSVYVRGAWQGRSSLYRVDVGTLAVETLSTGFDGDLTGFSAGGGRIVALYSSPGGPGDLYLVEPSGPRRLTSHGQSNVAGLALGALEERWVDSFDGQRIQYWILTPPGLDRTRKHPAILYIHGGPHAMYGQTFFHEFQTLAAAGYVVVYGNPRGSSGYGAEFGNVIQRRYPGDDARDLLATLDDAIALGFIDPQRLGVAGGSGGGVLSSWLIGNWPDRFQAAVVERAVLDWRQMMGSDIPLVVSRSWFADYPWADPGSYAARSSISLVERVKTPALIIHNAEDYRVPIGQALDYYGSLKALRKPAKLAVFPASSHGMSRDGTPEQRVARLKLILDWFDSYLKR
jgi:dipeptidyl aminopeptidase/acylaminoacyl peptidase